ncbi:MAG: phosphatase PAP2 family protein [Acidimicrobiales bacterium]
MRPWVELVRQVGFVVGAALLYFVVRGLTQGDVDAAVRNGHEVLAFEAQLGIDLEAWAQGLVVGHQWLVDGANSVYIWGHWPVITVTLLWLHRNRRADFLLMRNAMFISGAIGLVIFATYAVAPPRLLDGAGLLDTVTQHSNAYRILQPPALVNKYAAVPSLHVGWNLLVGIFLYRASRLATVRAFAVASPILMAIAVVVTANHYIIDGILGSGLALAGLRISCATTPRLIDLDHRTRRRWHDWQTARAAHRPRTAGSAPDATPEVVWQIPTDSTVTPASKR